MSESNNSYEEKRNFIRMLISTNVTISDPETGDSYIGSSQNLSGDGVMFVTDKEFLINQRLKVNINSDSGDLPPLSAEFEVKRVKPLDNEKFEIGGLISNIN